MRIFDLSLPTEPSPSELIPVEVNHISHEEGAAGMTAAFNCTRDDLPQGLGWAVDKAKLDSHSGTHVDAPWHYFPTSEGKKARKIDKIPLDWFYGDGVVLDMRHKPTGSGITVADLKKALAKINYKLKKNDIVLIQTGADKLWGKAVYLHSGSGMTAAATRWLIDQGIRVMGIDAWGWDRPIQAIKEEFRKTRDKSIIWAGHRVGIDKEYCHIEKLAKLDKLPKPYGFKVACFPVKLKGGSAGWCRVVAIYEE